MSQDWIAALTKDADKRLGLARLPHIRYRLGTPSTQLNCALGAGLPMGRSVEVIGDSGEGKTATVAGWGSMVQQAGGFVWWGDSENKFDLDLGAKCGLCYDPQFWRYDQPDNLEEYQSALEAYIKIKIESEAALTKLGQPAPPAMFVLDSLAMLGIRDLSKLAVDKSKLRPMSQSQQWTNFYQREAIKQLEGSNVLLVFINHIRDNPDLAGWGSKPQFKSPGGKVVKFMETIRIFLKSQKFIKDHLWTEAWPKKDSEYGYMVQYYVEKNSAGAPWRSAEIPFFFHKGFDDGLASLQYLDQKKLFQYDRSAQAYTIGGESFPTKAAALRRTQEDPLFVQLLQRLTCQAYQDNNTYSREDFCPEVGLG